MGERVHFPKKIDLGREIKVDRSHESGTLTRKCSMIFDPDTDKDDITTDTMGFWHEAKSTIYIANSQSKVEKYQTLLHEICEVFRSQIDPGMHHDRVVAHEQLLTNLLLNNRKFIRGFWRAHDAASD